MLHTAQPFTSVWTKTKPDIVWRDSSFVLTTVHDRQKVMDMKFKTLNFMPTLHGMHEATSSYYSSNKQSLQPNMQKLYLGKQMTLEH